MVKLTRGEYEIADNYLEYLRRQHLLNSAKVTLISDKEERQEKVEQLEREGNAINILIQLLNSKK